MNLETELEVEIKRQLQEGISQARVGNKAAAAATFSRILSVQPDNEDALVWQAAVTTDPARAVVCLEQALKINPRNRRAQAGLDWAHRRLHEPPEAEVVIEAENQPLPRRTPEPLIIAETESETNPSPPPYRKSRLTNKMASGIILPPEALPPAKPKRSKRNSDQIGVMAAAQPRFALTVSERVRWNERSGHRSAKTVNVIWPLSLFLVAICLALLTFLLSSLAPLFGGVALFLTVAGVILFDRADF